MRILGVLLVLAVATGCGSGTGSKSSTSGRPAACALVAKLDEIAGSVARADVHDPDAFDKTLESAVSQYVDNLRELGVVAPVNLRAGLARVEADVQQLRFDAALTDRSELDAYAARTCGRVVGTVPTTSGSTTGVVGVAPSTTQPIGSTTTTLVSNG